MKFLIVLAALAVAIMASPFPKNTITYEDENGNIVTEDLDQPTVGVYAADINKQRFILYNQADKTTGTDLKKGDATGLKNAKFNTNIPTKFLIHGWQNDYSAESVQVIKDAYLAKGQYNVIICDYKEYNSPYLTAVNNAKNVGNNIGSFIEYLIQQGMPKTSFHILGHSLGGHIAGFAGQYLKSVGSTAPRITGLDAAGPMFENKEAANRLSSDDATFVDGIHSSKEFGMENRYGTVDYYPNGGSNQPTCQHASMTGGCDHVASCRYFALSITKGETYPSHACASVAEAQAVTQALKVCKAGNIFMGEDSPKGNPSGAYFVGV